MRDLTYPPVIWSAVAAFRLLGQRIRIRGDQHVPRAGGVLLAVNHVGYVDFVYGGLAARASGRLVRFMAKREVFDHRLTGPLMRSLHHIEVDRADGEGSMRTAVEYLRAGEAVGIFPEATISRSMELKSFKTGAVRIATTADVPIVPVILWGTQRLMTKDRPRDLITRGRTITIDVGEPWRPNGVDPVAETAELRERMSEMLASAVAAYPADEQPAGSWWVPASMGGSAPTPERALELDAAERLERLRRAAARRNPAS